MKDDIVDDVKGKRGATKNGLIVGGSGLIGGYLTYHFKTKEDSPFGALAPNSKKLSLREVDDIKSYFKMYRPQFVINAAIASIDSDAQMSYEVNYLGAVNLARAALALGIPYIYFSSAAVLPARMNVTEEDHLPLCLKQTNYVKSKLMAESTLRHMGDTMGLDYTIVRLGIVYGQHDHKIQGVHRLLFTIANQAMPFMLTKKGVVHSYTNAGKLPGFVEYILEHRDEFSGQMYHFVDKDPVELAKLILAMKSALKVTFPKQIYTPYCIASMGKGVLSLLLKGVAKFGIETRMPGEIQFLESYYKNQTLSSEKLRGSSYKRLNDEATIFTELPAMINYYLARWEHLNLLSFRPKKFKRPMDKSDEFLNAPDRLLETTHRESIAAFSDIADS